VFLGNQIGLFGLQENADQPGMKVPQLAKLLLLNYRWPKILEICHSEPNFLNELIIAYNFNINELKATLIFPNLHIDSSEALLSILKEYLKVPELRTMLKYGTDMDTSDPTTKQDWLMYDIKLSTFLEVSPTYLSESYPSSIESAPSSMPA
jgi:hypothetical protein